MIFEGLDLTDLAGPFVSVLTLCETCYTLPTRTADVTKAGVSLQGTGKRG